jgi:hypothetical protein
MGMDLETDVEPHLAVGVDDEQTINQLDSAIATRSHPCR